MMLRNRVVDDSDSTTSTSSSSLQHEIFKHICSMHPHKDGHPSSSLLMQAAMDMAETRKCRMSCLKNLAELCQESIRLRSKRKHHDDMTRLSSLDEKLREGETSAVEKLVSDAVYLSIYLYVHSCTSAELNFVTLILARMVRINRTIIRT